MIATPIGGNSSSSSRSSRVISLSHSLFLLLLAISTPASFAFTTRTRSTHIMLLSPSQRRLSPSQRQRPLPPPPSSADVLWNTKHNANNNGPPALQFCAFCSTDASSSSSFSSSGSSSREGSLDKTILKRRQQQQPGRRQRSALFHNRPNVDNTASPDENDGGSSSIKAKLLKISNWASLLCVLDCTILPVVTVILPLLGLVSLSPLTQEWLHQLGHQVALYFVLPVGGLATTLNYTNHQQRRISLLACVGMALVLSANIGGGGCHAHAHAVHHHHVVQSSSYYSAAGGNIRNVVQSLLQRWLHLVHGGLAHRMCNLAGCACLLASNYWSRAASSSCHDPKCGVQHK